MLDDAAQSLEDIRLSYLDLGLTCTLYGPEEEFIQAASSLMGGVMKATPALKSTPHQHPVENRDSRAERLAHRRGLTQIALAGSSSTRLRRCAAY